MLSLHKMQYVITKKFIFFSSLVFCTNPIFSLQVI